MVRMAQSFSMHVPLIDGRGNFGSAALRRSETCTIRAGARCLYASPSASHLSNACMAWFFNSGSRVATTSQITAKSI